VVLAGSAQRLLPAGTLRSRPGLPTVVLLRGLSAGGFVAAQMLLPLVLVSERDLAPAVAGLVLTVGSVAWAAASCVRGRTSASREHRLLHAGMASLSLGILSALLLIATGGPTIGFVISWIAASAGMGLVVPTLLAKGAAWPPPAAAKKGEPEHLGPCDLVDTFIGPWWVSTGRTVRGGVARPRRPGRLAQGHCFRPAAVTPSFNGSKAEPVSVRDERLRAWFAPADGEVVLWLCLPRCSW
jgi:hypothetical protein